jgi:hypothetical protein
MKIKAFNTLVIASLLLISTGLHAQKTPKAPAPPPKHERNVIVLDLPSEKDMDAILDNVNIGLKNLDIGLKSLDKALKNKLAALGSIEIDLSGLEDLPEVDEIDIKIGPDSVRHNSGHQDIRAEKIKKISKSYTVDANDKLSINNQYGKVVVKVWNKNEINVDADIKAYERSDEKAQDLLDGVEIEESKSGNLISFKTNISSTSKSWALTLRGNGDEQRHGVSIDYTVYMPSRNAIDITNKFGNINLPDFNGPTTIKCSYGSLQAADLQNTVNTIAVRYGSATIEGMAGGNVDVSYGSLNIANANQVNADVKYGSTKIGKLGKGGKLDNRYGSLRIDELNSDIKDLSISTDKGSVFMGVKSSANFDFDVTVHMGRFQFPQDRTRISSQTPDNERGPTFTKNYKGKVGKGSDSQIEIKSNFGSVQIQ